MTTSAPPPSPTPAAQGTATASTPAAPAPTPLGEAQLIRLPDRLQMLNRPVMLPGTVAGQTRDGAVQVRTQAGEVTVRLPSPVQLNQAILLQIPAGNPPARAVALAPQPPPQPSAPQQPANPPPSSGTQASHPRSPAPHPPGKQGGPVPMLPQNGIATTLTVPIIGLVSTPATLPQPGMVLPAVILSLMPGLLPRGQQQPGSLPAGPPSLPAAAPSGISPASGSAPADGTPPAAPASSARPPAMAGLPASANPGGNPTGAMLAGEALIGGVFLPQPGSGAERPLALPGDMPAPPASGAGMPSQGGPSQGGPGQTGSIQQTGNTMGLRILAIAAPDSPQVRMPPATGNDGAAVLVGTITGRTPAGLSILTTPQGGFALPAALPQGTVMTVALTEPGQLTAKEPLLGLDAETNPAGWSSLRQVMAALAGADRTALNGLLSTVMPQPNRRLGAALAFFLAAARGGDGAGWLGEEASGALAKIGRKDLLTRLIEEFRSMARQTGETPPGDWRPFLVPFLDGEALTFLNVHVRSIGEDDEARTARDRREHGSRFLIDVELSRFGALQFDGLVQPRRFDLILRSRAALPDEVRTDLPRIFGDCLAAVGYTGGLTFQVGNRGWVVTQPADARHVGLNA